MCIITLWHLVLQSDLCIKQSIDRIYDYFASYDTTQYKNREQIKADNQFDNNKYLELVQKYTGNITQEKDRNFGPIESEPNKQKKKYLMIMPEKYKKNSKKSNKSKKKKVTVEREPKPFRMIQSKYGFK